MTTKSLKGVDASTLLAILAVLVGFLVLWSYRWDVIESFSGFYERREIEPGLWIGSLADSKDREFVDSEGIRLIVNCTYNLPRHFKGDSRNIAYVTVPVRDNRIDVPKMSRHLPGAVAAIQKHRRRGDPVLIHCFAGISRSATVCAAYLMAEKDLTVPEAIQYIRDQKPETFGPRPVFKKSLDEYYLLAKKK